MRPSAGFVFRWRRVEHHLAQASMQALAVTDRQLKDAVVSREDDDVACRIKHGRADLAVCKMLFHIGAGLRIQRVVEIAEI